MERDESEFGGRCQFSGPTFVVVFERFKDLENFRFDPKLLTKLRRIYCLGS